MAKLEGVAHVVIPTEPGWLRATSWTGSMRHGLHFDIWSSVLAGVKKDAHLLRAATPISDWLYKSASASRYLLITAGGRAVGKAEHLCSCKSSSAPI